MSPKRLLTVAEAAELLGVPKEGLRKTADQLGLTILIGKAVRLNPDDFQELIEKCRVKPKVLASTSASAKDIHQYGKSGTTAMFAGQPALETAAKLRKLSRPT